ncbi:uncharacterized protein [Clytia hemisphaerica]|uniref:Integrase core domain-containing protein n=2 Tax=Clytia hemisphaerica TaxID=252671 RepID=A0A7M5XF75_9CNID
MNRNNFIINSFHQGLSYKEILACLLKSLNLVLSLRQLKRILRDNNLRRRGNNNQVAIVNAIQSELRGDGCNLGYRSMHQKLILRHRLNTSREQVRLLLLHLDPEGVESRKRRRLRRRTYHCRGPNDVWHIDGYDKLKPYGFAVHGCVDGYSRKVLWLTVGSTNNDPEIIAKHYLDYVSEIKGTARRIRADCGTENSNVAGVQRFFRLHAEDEDDNFSGLESFLYGKSTSNQRIEAYWSRLRGAASQFWINLFKDMRDAGELDETDDIYRDCLRFSFMGLVQQSLDDARLLHNTHRIRPYPLQECPNGKPNIIYGIPEAYDTVDYKVEVEEDEIGIAREVTKEPLELGCSVEFLELANFIMEEEGLQAPENVDEAKILYFTLTAVIRNGHI